jgi:large subunit ribosomal protein L24
MQKIKKGDMVEVISGNSKGKRGKILKVLKSKNRVVIEKVNMVKKHIKANQKNPSGGISEQEGSVAVSNIMLVCPSSDKPTKVGIKKLEDGKAVRYSKRSKDIIDK